MQWAATVHQAGVSQRKGLSGQASQSHRLRKGVADLEMRSASTVHGLLQRSDDDTTSNNTKEGQPTDFLNLPPPPLRAANRGRPPQAKLKKVGTCYCIPTLNFASWHIVCSIWSSGWQRYHFKWQKERAANWLLLLDGACRRLSTVGTYILGYPYSKLLPLLTLFVWFGVRGDNDTAFWKWNKERTTNNFLNLPLPHCTMLPEGHCCWLNIRKWELINVWIS